MDILATTQDSIYQGKHLLEQPRDGYRFGTDAMLLAASVEAKPGERVLELGCGVGAVLLAAHTRLPDVYFTGVERVPEYIELAKRNILMNQATRRVSVFRSDVLNSLTMRSLGMFNHIVANPPYFEAGRHSPPPSDIRRLARQHEPEALAEWIQAANRLLKPKGTVTFIHSAEKLDELLVGLKRFCGGIQVFPFWPNPGKACKRLIVRGIKGSRAPMSVLPGLVIHDEGGHSTQRALDIVNHGHNLWD